MNETARRVLVAVLVFAGFLALYLATTAPGLLFHDSGEFQTVAAVGGIPHSTGYPTFVLAGRVFTALLPGDVAWRVNAMSAFFGASTIALLLGALVAFGVRLPAAAATAIAFGLSFTFWRATSRAEVYTIATCFAAGALLAGFLAWRHRSFRLTLLTGFLMGLTACSHLSYAPAIALAGIALAWRTARDVRPAIPALFALLAAFLLGAAPFLYIPWADARHVPANFLDHVARLKFLLADTTTPFEAPLDKLRWLVLGGNYFPPRPFVFHLRPAVVNTFTSVSILALFELGPVAVVAALFGLAREWPARRALAAVLVAGLAGVSVFASLVQGGPMLHLLQLPAMLLALPFIARGLEAALDATSRRDAGTRGLAWLVALALLVVPQHALRLYAAEHPIPPKRLHVEEEGVMPRAGWFPSLRGFDDARRYTDAALAAAPESALVLAAWTEYTPLRHRLLVEHARPDLRIETAIVEVERRSAAIWRSDPLTAHRPIVLTESGPALDSLRAETDSLAMPGGRWLWIVKPEARPSASAIPDSAGT